MQLTTFSFIIIMATLTVPGTADNAQDRNSKETGPRVERLMSTRALHDQPGVQDHHELKGCV